MSATGTNQGKGWAPLQIIGIGVLGVLVIGAAILAWRTVRPRALVTGWTPAAGTDAVSGRTAVRIAFAEPMVQEEAEAHFQIEPPREGSLAWTGNTLLYRPSSSWVYGQTYTVTLQAGAHSRRGRQVQSDVTWSFHVGYPRLTYLAVGGQEHLQLYAVTPGDGPPAQLTPDGQDVWDYAVHPEGASIAYSVLGEGDRADLWQVDRDGSSPRPLLRCPDASCTAPAWSADGRQLAYERQDLSETTIGVLTGVAVPHIWLLDARTGDTMPLHADTPTPGRSPLWAPAGARLAFYDLSERAIQIYDLDSGQQQIFDTLGDVGTWDPQGDQMVLSDLVFDEEDSGSYLVRVEFTTRNVVDLGSPSAGGDSMPHWSPTGEWIAFGRAMLADGTRTPGTQLWLMRPDGSESHPLVADGTANHGAFAWRPDGQAIAYVCLAIEELADPHPELWVVSLADGQASQVAAEAIMPGWLP